MEHQVFQASNASGAGWLMNFVITRQNLHAGIAAVSASIPSKTTLPVLSNILFEAREDGVWMSGTDLDVAVRVKVPADVKEAGSLTAPGKKLQEYLARPRPGCRRCRGDASLYPIRG